MHHKPAGSVMVVEFEIEGQTFTALNGGPQFKFNEAMSFQVRLRDPGRDRLLLGQADRKAAQEGPCGWLKDKFGLSWQVVPAAIAENDDGSGSEPKSERVMNAFMKMKKLDIAAIERAYAGSTA